MFTADFHYDLPPELIAQKPVSERDRSRLLVLHRSTGQMEDRDFRWLPGYLRPGDVLVLNNSRVIPARLRGTKAVTHGEFEILLVEELQTNDWWVMLRPGKRVRPGTVLHFRTVHDESTTIEATVVEKNDEGHCRLRFAGTKDILEDIHSLGEVPLPPYIMRAPGNSAAEDQQRYQTVYAQAPGSVAAPTAGLHFTGALLEEIRRIGVTVCYVTLHVGLGTFAPVKARELTEHRMHEERYDLPAETVHAVEQARRSGGRVVAVGTTTVRVLESVAAAHGGTLVSGSGRTRIFIYPPYSFKAVDALITNFHLPESTLLMLVSALASPNDTQGREIILRAYRHAVEQRYRFFSYGDAMLVL